MSRWMELLTVSFGGIFYWILSVLFFNRKSRVSSPRDEEGGSGKDNDFFQFLQQFAKKGGLHNIFPGDDSRDSSIQFELISQVHCTTSVGKPISVTVRNTPSDRRRMRMFGGY
ncbi:hypothetical protein ABK040_014684 [Willaertia magna]